MQCNIAALNFEVSRYAIFEHAIFSIYETKCLPKYGLSLAKDKPIRYQEAVVFCAIYFVKTFRKFVKFTDMI